MSLDRFLPAGTLGEGSYGSVFTVYRESDGACFAAKSFSASDDDETLEAGTLRELSILVALRRERERAGKAPHPNIMPAVAVTEIEGIDGFCMVMPSLPMSLGTAILAKALNRDAKMGVAIGLLRALAFLHANSIIHRDVKPDNVLLTEDLTPILADFSLAKVLSGAARADARGAARGGKRTRGRRAESDASSAAGNTAGMGTPTYMAPEVVRGSSYTCAADMWSAGVVIYETVSDAFLSATKDKAAFRILDDLRARLSADKPVPALLRKLLIVDADERIGAPAAIAELLVAQRAMPGVAGASAAPQIGAVDDGDERELALDYFATWAAGVLPHACPRVDALGHAAPAAASSAAPKRRRVDAHSNRSGVRDIDSIVARCCATLDSQNPLTPLLAVSVARRTGAKPMHAAVLCAKLLEVELNDLEGLEGCGDDDGDDDGARGGALGFVLDEYVQAERDIFASLGFSLYV
ncbi:hypothetical protein KFE25_002054 [Diacronema lutheri]|uniref:Protein kinase domain-containing protein n=1 Tax=Diacronema lutheri TaxID=2081491 RepID=A0A8J6CG36_DIALT|nr:hypothetical protein KFE25_002054 [Diacronema lutheri]